MNRDSLLDKIRALMSKTIDNGCTEHEALAALDKARAMMDAYEVTDDELKLAADLSAILHSNGASDPHGIKSALGVEIAAFCDCKVWKGVNGLVFCGLPSDAQFASWLVNNLAAFIQSELTRHLMGALESKGRRRLLINGFCGGATNRINTRLRDLRAESAIVVSSNSRALVVTKGTVIADKMKAEGIVLGKARSSRHKIDRSSYAAGQSAGDRASFGRPIGGGGHRMIGC